MRRYKMLVMSRPAEGREDEYNAWYQDVHLPELVSLPGIVSARRFRLARKVSEVETYPYLAVYDIETDDIDGVYEQLASGATSGTVTMSDVIDTDSAYAVIYESFGPEVTAAGKDEAS